MSTYRSAAILAAAASIAVATAASAGAAAALTLTDPRGDANAVNGQGQQAGLGDRSGPAQRADADIVSVSFSGTRTAKAASKTAPACSGFTATLELAGAPASTSTLYRVQGRAGYDDSLIWVDYDTAAVGTTTQLWRDPVDGPSKFVRIAPAKVAGNKVVFTVTHADLTTIGGSMNAFTLWHPNAETRTTTGEMIVPVWDSIEPDDSKVFACK